MNDAQRIARLEQTVSQLLKRKDAEIAAKNKKIADMQSAQKDAMEKNPIERAHDQLARALPDNLRPRNLGKYADAVWSYWFPMVSGVVAPGSAVDVQVAVTQEAAFIMSHMFATAYLYEANTPGAGQNRYTLLTDLNPLPLKVTLIDAQSTRQFMHLPEPIALLGTNELPRKLPTPNFYLPNSTIVVRVQNDSPTYSYKVVVNLLGARVRISDAQALGTMLG